MTVSVVIPTYNRARLVAETIASVLSQTLAPHEVIVVDDGSTDDTPGVLAQFGSRVRVLRQRNRGMAPTRNAGAALATGDALAFVDSDDTWLPAKLERQVARLAAEPELGLVHCGVDEVDDAGRYLRTRLDGLEGRVADEMLLFRRAVILGGGSGVMMPRRIFEEVGGFDEALSTSADWDLYYRVARRYPVGFIAAPLVRYRVHAGNFSRQVSVMEADMLRAYGKAFAGERRGAPLRREAYARLHGVLAGSFFQAGDYRAFARHALRSLTLSPRLSVRFAGYPIRALRRLAGGGNVAP